MRSRVAYVIASVMVLLAMARGSGIVGRWPSRAASESLVISDDRDQDVARNTIIEKVGDLPAMIDKSDPSLHLQFIGEGKGWFATGRKLWTTEDGGKTWLLLYESSARRIGEFQFGIREFQFVGREMGWMIADERMFKTNDGGSTWESFSQPVPTYWEGHLANFKFLENGIHGWVAGGVYVPLRQDDPYDYYCPQRYITLIIQRRGPVRRKDFSG